MRELEGTLWYQSKIENREEEVKPPDYTIPVRTRGRVKGKHHKPLFKAVREHTG